MLALVNRYENDKNTMLRVKDGWNQKGYLRRIVVTGPARISNPEQDDALLETAGPSLTLNPPSTEDLKNMSQKTAKKMILINERCHGGNLGYFSP